MNINQRICVRAGRLFVWIALAVVAVACTDVVTPPDGQQLGGWMPALMGDVVSQPIDPDEMHILQQAPTAPVLETYQVSFWARKDKASTVVVNYANGQPFLRFDIPKDGLKRGPPQYQGLLDDDGNLRKHDSLLITLTIDPREFSVDFQPSGVVFDKHHPAMLIVWYQNADPDFNRDGVVDEVDAALTEQLAIWLRNAKKAPWKKLLSGDEADSQFVWTQLRHFSEYAVSW